jgi:hypothetical protein
VVEGSLTRGVMSHASYWTCGTGDLFHADGHQAWMRTGVPRGIDFISG